MLKSYRTNRKSIKKKNKEYYLESKEFLDKKIFKVYEEIIDENPGH